MDIQLLPEYGVPYGMWCCVPFKDPADIDFITPRELSISEDLGNRLKVWNEQWLKHWSKRESWSPGFDLNAWVEEGIAYQTRLRSNLAEKRYVVTSLAK